MEGPARTWGRRATPSAAEGEGRDPASPPPALPWMGWAGAQRGGAGRTTALGIGGDSSAVMAAGGRQRLHTARRRPRAWLRASIPVSGGGARHLLPALLSSPPYFGNTPAVVTDGLSQRAEPGRADRTKGH